MASYDKQPNGTWRVFVCKKRVRDSATFDTKAQAREWAGRREDEIVNGLNGTSRTLRQSFKRYVDEDVPHHRGKRWEEIRVAKFCGEGKDPKHQLPFIDKRLSELSSDDLTGWKAAMKHAGLKDSTIRREYGMIRAVLRKARIEWKWTTNNPIEGFKPPKKPKDRRRRVSHDELERLVLALNYTRGNSPKTVKQYVACAFMLAIETAMREGEMLVLSRDRLSADRTYIRTLKTKNGSERDVPLSAEALSIIDLLPHEGLLFPVKSSSFGTTLRKALQRAGIVDLHFHDTRHEGITRLAKKLQVLELARAVGHDDLNSLLIYYESNASEMAAKLRGMTA